MIKFAVSVQLYATVKLMYARFLFLDPNCSVHYTSYIRSSLSNHPYFVNRGQPTKYKFYRRCEVAAMFYLWQVLSNGQNPPPTLVILEGGIVTFLHTIQQWFPTFYMCDPTVANGMWPTTLPSKWQQSVISTINELILMPFLEHYLTLPLIKKY
jgi:hypothetical protein